MVPNGAAYDNFPSFANNGTKTPPGGSTESAKYALGMVPADTFPAEWANYLFHGATAGITRLNSDTGSIKKEINTVLACKNITPDASSCDQLYCALTKIRDDAVALAWPVGSIYMNAKSATLPASIQAVGTWCAIDGRFLRACASCITCTAGSASVTLAVCNLPSHCHTTGDHCHSITDHKHSGTVGNHNHKTPDHCHTGPSHSHTIVSAGAGLAGCFWMRDGCSTQTGCLSTCKSSVACGASWTTTAGNYFGCVCTQAHTHTACAGGTGNTGTAAPTTCCTQPSFTGGSMCAATNTGNAAPTTCNTGSGCSFSILPPYRDVAAWYRDA